MSELNSCKSLQFYKKKQETLLKKNDINYKELSCSFYNKADKINRWIYIMNNSENINVAFLHILEEIEENIMERLKTFQKNINNTIENKFGSLINQNSIKVYTSTYVKELKKKLDIILPINNLETFKLFDNILEQDVSKQNALRNYFYFLIDGNQGINHDIYTIMSTVTTKSVQICYSGVGKEKNGQKKKNFSKTNIFFCMQDVLIDKYKQSASTLKITTRVSRWLSQVIKRKDKSKKSKHKPTKEFCS